MYSRDPYVKRTNVRYFSIFLTRLRKQSREVTNSSSINGELVDIATIVSTWAATFYSSAALLVQEAETTVAPEGAPIQGDPVDVGNAVEAADPALAEKLSGHAKEISDTLNQDQTIQDVSAGILEPIYSLAEFMSWPSFYWVAFMLMVAGVVSFAGQLLFAKFFLLFKLNLNFKEILSDLLGLAISVVGLVLTTQAATQNSTFAENSFAVVSAAVVGAIVGFIFYWWGQKLEFTAANRASNKEARAS